MQISRTTLWLAALVAALIGTLVLYDATPGVNWGIWVALASAGVLAVRASATKPILRHTLALLGWATILAFAQSVTAVEPHSPLIVATVAILLGLAVTTLDGAAPGITLPSVAQVPFSAVTRVARQSATELFALPRSVRALKDGPALRGILIAIPIAFILLTLLSKADPVLESVRSVLLGWTDNWVLDGRFLFFIFLTLLTLGAFGSSFTARAQESPSVPAIEPPFRLSRRETQVILGSVNAILWLFVVLQLFSFTRNPGGTAGTGLTYAEYARRGFAELSVAAAIVLGVILFVEVFSKRKDGTEKRTLQLAAIFAVVLILGSAFRRVMLYEAAYGYTTDRLIAQVYMIVLAIAFILLAVDLSRGGISAAFGRRGMMLTLSAVTAFTFWNYESWIVGENLERARNGAELDLNYLNKLSLAAVPALIEGRSELSAPDRATLDAMLRCRKVNDAPHWYEWNLRRERARQVLAPFSGKCARNRTAIPLNL